jgi:hypothetical protein
MKKRKIRGRSVLRFGELRTAEDRRAFCEELLRQLDDAARGEDGCDGMLILASEDRTCVDLVPLYVSEVDEFQHRLHGIPSLARVDRFLSI